MMFSAGLCGHFALGTLLETWRKECVLETNVQDKNVVTNIHIQKSQILQYMVRCSFTQFDI